MAQRITLQSGLTRRRLLAGGATLAAATVLPRYAPAAGFHDGDTNDGFIPESALPVLELDPRASLAEGRIMTKGPARADPSWGAVILVPAGLTLPTRWWGLRVGRRTSLQDGARIVLRSADAANPAHLIAPGNEGVLELQNLSDRRVLMAVEDLRITGGRGGNAIRIDRVSAAHLRRLRITGGKNGVFATHHPTDILIDGCDLRRGGRGDGYSHNLYTGYVRSLTVRDSQFHAPATPAHAFKCYARKADVRGSVIAHYLDPEDSAAGFHGHLPLIDRGAWGDTVMADNLFVRRGPARPVVIDLRNRAFPPGFRPHVRAGWGTEEVPFHSVDNRDPHNPHLFRHLFYRNLLVNGIAPDGGEDPLVARNPGILVRNNGSAPWNASAAGEKADGIPPDGWAPQHERAVAYLCDNRVEGIPLARLAQNWAYRRRDFTTPVEEWERLPDWARAWAAL